jgi:hypothetical protein
MGLKVTYRDNLPPERPSRGTMLDGDYRQEISGLR